MLQDVRDMFVAPQGRRPKATEVAAQEVSPEFALRRTRRRDDFNLFRRYAEDFFTAPPADDAHKRMTARHGYFFALGATPQDDAEDGAAPTGLNPRVIECFYGARQLEAGDQLAEGRLQKEWRQVSETGAALLYVQGDDGVVTAFLYPAAMDNMKAEEDAIELARFTETEALTGRGLLASHWLFFRAYAEATSFDGEPSLADRVRVAWMRVTCPRIVDGRRRPTALLDLAKQTAVVAAAVAIGLLAAL